MKVVLIGYRGTGKTVVGRLLARRLGLPFIDTDAATEGRAGMSIPAIFERLGEEAFRAIERSVIAGLADEEGVISTGGGAVLDPANVAALRRGGTVVLLHAPASVIAERIAGSDRPPLTALPPDEEIREVLAIRRPYYLRAADICVDTAALTPGEVAEAVLDHLHASGRDIGILDGFSMPSGERKRLASLPAPTRLFGIAGHPVLHSRSPELWNALFAECGLDAHYTFLGHPDFSAVLDAAVGLGVQGLSVTIPHKESALNAADRADPHAEAIGAANTLLIRCGMCCASNTDWIGVRRPLDGVLPGRAVVLGAGGAAAAAVYALLDLGCEVTVLARNPEQSRALAGRFGCDSGTMQQFGVIRPEIVIHATPVGMGGDPGSLLSPADLLPSMTVFDLVYTPAETPLLRIAAELGCRTISGTGMFVYQACEQFLHMTGIRVLPERVREVLGV
ncbi:shikimate kinase [Methanofollis fontis]|uniref:Shikimate dehydrogenase (NADP(+)) n=1 Tax=Methanofollis fontis TaxID=2052832 RepID=A0A483CV45_9EURY|nr:shikimate kinase [Methanofollis fontis]TAJ45347.1 shikimate dehydrogenase [Methanofollis fontis]